MKYRTSLIIGSLVSALIFAAPVIGFAKNGNGNGNSNGNGNGHGDNAPRAEQQVNNSQSNQSTSVQAKHHDSENEQGDDNDRGLGSCITAFGHLIAPGWIRHNGQVDLSRECPLPPGIAKRFHGGTGTTTPPGNTVLTISSLSSTAQASQAEISWNTNNSADSTVWYSTSTPVSTTTAQSATSAAMVFNHFITLNGLNASTTYYFMVQSHDSFGNTATSSESSFTTTPAPVVNPLVVSNAVAIVGTSTVHLSWNTNIAADSEVYFATTSPVTIGATSTTALTNAALGTSHNLTASGLATSTTYYFLIQSKDAANDTTSTGQFSVTTGT